MARSSNSNRYRQTHGSLEVAATPRCLHQSSCLSASCELKSISLQGTISLQEVVTALSLFDHDAPTSLHDETEA